MKYWIFLLCVLLMALTSLGCDSDYCTFHDENNIDYAYEIGDMACDYCFKTTMVSASGGCAWATITCKGDHNKLTMWAEGDFNEVSCHDPEYECRKETRYLDRSTLDEYNCEQIEVMMKTNVYKKIDKHYRAKTCFSGKNYSTDSSHTADCKECAKNQWVNKYINECT